MFFAKHVELNKPSLPKVSNNRLSNRPFLFLRWTYTVYLQHHFYNVVLCWVLAEDTEDVANITTRDLTRPLNKTSALLIARGGNEQFSNTTIWSCEGRKTLENNNSIFFLSLFNDNLCRTGRKMFGERILYIYIKKITKIILRLQFCARINLKKSFTKFFRKGI